VVEDIISAAAAEGLDFGLRGKSDPMLTAVAREENG